MAWNILHVGILFLAQRFLSIYLALNITHNLNFKTQFDPYFLRDKLINEQEEDGSWMQLVDLNKKEGSLDATIFNCISYPLI